MFQFQVITVSEPTGAWYTLLEHYHDQLIHLARLRLTHLRQDNDVEREGQRILKALPKESVIIVCDEHGKLYDSHQFVERLQHWSIQHTVPIVFVIGGPFGLSAAVKAAASQSLALASWTLPHDLAAVVLLEQLYRACTISSGKVYHY